ncbi:MAG: DUF288 domain-containing protein [Cyanothece sp. SIO1E1]|nr:DUF288 domain-containing protein [Cyanothece sp. SIO1E1]
MSKFIVITSINYPTEAIKKFSEIEGWQIVVVADLKTPKDWRFDNVKLLTVAEQKALPFETAKLLPWNHYARKNLGYLYAIMKGADLIYETDDDNIPYDFWPNEFHPLYLDAEICPSSDQKFFNVYTHFCDANVWPRGFPLTKVCKAVASAQNSSISRISAPIQQGLADLEPDVDAIYRLTVGKQIKFSKKNPLFMRPGVYCPFNSQNTLWYTEAFQYLFLPASVPSRVTDIWRGYIAQHFLYQEDHGVLFCNPNVYQERNFHNLLHDFAEEIELYTQAENLIKCLEDYSERLGKFSGVMRNLQRHNFVQAQDSALFEAWLKDLRSLNVHLS